MKKTEVLDDANRKLIHRKNKSDDLDVFEASMYLSGGMDAVEHDYNVNESQKIIKQSKSPGARLAGFFTSLFIQTGSKKKNKKEDKGEITLDTGKIRRSSMSHFYSSRFPKSFEQSSVSDLSNPSNELKHQRSHVDNKKPVTRLCFNEKIKYVTFLRQNGSSDDKKTINVVFPERNVGFCDSMKTKDMVLNNGVLKKNGSCNDVAYGNMIFNKRVSWNIRSMFDGIPAELNFNEFEKDEDGAESDSSSDLFELNCVI